MLFRHVVIEVTADNVDSNASQHLGQSANPGRSSNNFGKDTPVLSFSVWSR